ncbi:unnamed protein product [Mycena citricolor]|uniref:Uncharacterized protein n=1 Tax=Mycena citricolor TaxID=2018698 RepID=A0AAD2H981_9AGAR|nr:unnamed protein product [Mycena citricolor]
MLSLGGGGPVGCAHDREWWYAWYDRRIYGRVRWSGLHMRAQKTGGDRSLPPSMLVSAEPLQVFRVSYYRRRRRTAADKV